MRMHMACSTRIIDADDIAVAIARCITKNIFDGDTFNIHSIHIQIYNRELNISMHCWVLLSRVLHSFCIFET